MKKTLKIYRDRTRAIYIVDDISQNHVSCKKFHHLSDLLGCLEGYKDRLDQYELEISEELPAAVSRLLKNGP